MAPSVCPHSFLDRSKRFRRISPATFWELFDCHPNFERLFVVDGRTKAEYAADHIRGAIQRHPIFGSFASLYPQECSLRTLFIFHCELSTYRAPIAGKKFQDQHRAAGRDPSTLHAFVLDGGFSRF
jgi:rhodanese-related sulfurtransferase